MASTGHSVIDHLEDGDERQYKASDYEEARKATGVNVQGYKSDGKSSPGRASSPPSNC